MHRVALALLVLAGSAGAEDLPARLASTAGALAASLPAEAQREGRFAFDDDERFDLRFAPLFQDGARHGELPDESAMLAEQLLALSLSPRGMDTLRLVRRNELAMRRKDAEGWLPAWLTTRFRDPGRYFLALFGEPGGGGAWGYRYEGHHLSLNLTVATDAAPANTPLFLGAEPRVVPAGEPDAGAAVLGEEEAAARALLAALPAPLRARATLRFEDGRALVLGQVSRVELAAPLGLARADMPPAARAQLDRLVELFTGRFAAEIATARLAEIEAAGRDALYFAWTEAAAPPGAYYFRVQGPRTLIEADNTTDGDHVHAVWHDTENDFGDSLLAAHHRAVPHLAAGDAQ